MFMFIFIFQEEVEEIKCVLKDCMMWQFQELFGDIIVKVMVIFFQCVYFDDEFIINDIVVLNEEGFYFWD